MWLMSIHPDKSSHIHIGQEMDVSQFEYMIGPMIVKFSTAEKDLGVTIDNNLTFGDHIIEKITKANKMAGWIRRSFQFMNKDIFVLLYKSMVRSHIEYAACVWNPYLWKFIDKLEEVQIRATKMVPELKHMEYHERLEALQLPTLSYRRVRGDMITVYKIINKIYHQECCPILQTLYEKNRET